MASITPFLRHWLAIVFVQALASECGGLVLGQGYIGEPRDVVVQKFGSFMWPCRPIRENETLGPVNVTWRFNGSRIREDARREVLKNGSLYFKRVGKKDITGSDDAYDCILQDNLGRLISTPAKLYVAGLSRSSKADENISITQGDTVWLQCPISVTPPHAKPTYKWDKNKTFLPPNSRYKILPGGVLEIRDVQFGDQGHYKCAATLASVNEEKKSRQIQLVVEPGLREQAGVQFLNDRVQKLTVKAGEKVVLLCGVSALPRPTVSWFYGNRSSVDYNRFTRVGQGSLEISNVTRDHNGTYICSATNAVSTTPVESTIILRIVEPPRVLQEFYLKEPFKVSQYVELVCNISGYPPPTITWFHNAKPILFAGRYSFEGNKMKLENSVAGDSGYFQCRGENEAGIAQITAHINFSTSDSAAAVPHRITVEEVTSDSMFVKWNSTEVIFSVHHAPDGGVEESFVVVANAYHITGLKPHTNYTVYIIAYNNDGASPPSEKVVQLTKDAIPLNGPLPRTTPLGENSFKVEWDPLSPAEARGVITEYEVIYRVVGSPSENVEKVLGNTHELVVTGLHPQLEYEVCIRASSRAGFNDPKTNQCVEVGMEDSIDIFVAAPTNVLVQSVNSSALLITWKYDGPTVAGFLLQYHKMSDLSSSPVDFKKDLLAQSDRYTIGSLEPDSWYQISLMAKSPSGKQSAPVVRESSTTAVGVQPTGNPHDTPPQPHDVVAKPHNSTAIDVEWHMRSGAHVDAYIVRYFKVIDGPNEEIIDQADIKILRSTGDRRRLLINGLEQYTTYQFQVQGQLGTHRGPPSSLVRCRTDEGVPSQPRKLQLTLKDDTTVSVNWEPPAQANGQITHYLIVFTNGETLVDDNDADAYKTWNKTIVNGSTSSIDIKNLESSAAYNFKVAAMTEGGTGEFSRLQSIQTKDIAPTQGTRKDKRVTEDKKMGIIIGVSIGGACIILSIVIILLRNRFLTSRPPASEPPVTRRANGNSYIPNVNGNGFGPHGGNVRLSSESHESYPMLPQTQIPENQQSDTRGGVGHVVMNGIYPPINMNGVRVNLQPNGHVRSTPIYGEDDANKPQVPQRSSSLLATQEESERLVRNNSMDSIDHEDGERDVESASLPGSRHSDSGSQSGHSQQQRSLPPSTGPSNSSERQQQPHHQMSQEQQPPISATSSQKQQKQQQQQQSGEHKSPKMPSSTSSVSSDTTPSSNSVSYQQPSTRAAAVRRSWDREGGLDQPGAGGDGVSHDTSSTKLLPAGGRHDPLPHV